MMYVKALHWQKRDFSARFFDENIACNSFSYMLLYFKAYILLLLIEHFSFQDIKKSMLGIPISEAMEAERFPKIH